ncbi:hypothetical protein [Yersinia thracica]|uniref:hypothetical protein n=1 Tax=Yersinia thracica TaxID=2890319 RepID=UPI00157DD127|nr:hypothetical protein [Yersinia thracica]
MKQDDRLNDADIAAMSEAEQIAYIKAHLSDVWWRLNSHLEIPVSVGGELDGVDRPVTKKPTHPAMPPPSSPFLAYYPCNRVYVMRFGVCRTAKSGKGFHRSGVTITR